MLLILIICLALFILFYFILNKCENYYLVLKDLLWQLARKFVQLKLLFLFICLFIYLQELLFTMNYLIIY